MIVRYRPTGVDPWCDVAITPQGFAFAYSTPKGVVVEYESGAQWWSTSVSVSWLHYLRLDDSGLFVVGTGHEDDLAYVVGPSSVKTVGKAHGQDSVCIRNGLVYVMLPPDGAAYAVYSAESGGLVRTVPCTPTSQGFADVRSDGSVLFRDGRHTQVVQGRLLSRPMERLPLVVGQGRDDRTEALFVDRPLGFTVFPVLSFEPHVAKSGERFAVAARTPQGAAFASIAPPYPVDEFFPQDKKPARFNMLNYFLGTRNAWPRNDRATVFDYQVQPGNRIAVVKQFNPTKCAYFYIKDGALYLGQDFTAGEQVLRGGYGMSAMKWFPLDWDLTPFDVTDNVEYVFDADAASRGQMKVISSRTWAYRRWAEWLPSKDFGGDVGVLSTLKVYRDSRPFTHNPRDYEIAYLTEPFGDTAFEDSYGGFVCWNRLGGQRVSAPAPLEPFPTPRSEEEEFMNKRYRIAIQSVNGKFVCAEEGGALKSGDRTLAGEVRANRDSKGSWEEFILTVLESLPDVDPPTARQSFVSRLTGRFFGRP